MVTCSGFLRCGVNPLQEQKAAHGVDDIGQSNPHGGTGEAQHCGQTVFQSPQLGRALAKQPDRFLTSGMRSDSPRPRKCMKESRSLIRYSVRSSDKLFSVWITRILNISTGSNGGGHLNRTEPCPDQDGTPQNPQSGKRLRVGHRARSNGLGVIQHQRNQVASFQPSLITR